MSDKNSAEEIFNILTNGDEGFLQKENAELSLQCDVILELYFLILFKETARIQNTIECANARDKKAIVEHIDELVNYSIDHERHEITAYLLDYKYKNNLFPLKYLELE